MTDSSGLLDYAEQVLDGKVALGSSGPRTAALLARCALEDWLDAKSAAWSSTTHPFPSKSSKLVALATLGDRDVGERAQRVWNALSRRGYHHAYELQPAVAQVRLLVKQVRELGN